MLRTWWSRGTWRSCSPLQISQHCAKEKHKQGKIVAMELLLLWKLCQYIAVRSSYSQRWTKTGPGGSKPKMKQRRERRDVFGEDMKQNTALSRMAAYWKQGGE